MFDMHKPPTEVPLEEIVSLRNLTDDSAEIIGHFEKLYETPPNPWTASPRREREIEPSALDEDVLEKSANTSSRGRRLAMLRQFVKSRLALHETVEEIVAFAKQHDPARALELLEASEGLS